MGVFPAKQELRGQARSQAGAWERGKLPPKGAAGCAASCERLVDMMPPSKLLLAAAVLALYGAPHPAARAADATSPATPPALNPADMDPNVKPGDDFYHYADGTWLKNNPIPPDQTRWGSFSLLAENNKAVLHVILDECADYATASNRTICREHRPRTNRRSATSTPAAWTRRRSTRRASNRSRRTSRRSTRWQGHRRVCRHCWRSCTSCP